MLDGVFARGTTPTQVFPIPGFLRMKDFNDLTVTYRQKGKEVLKKRKSDTQNIADLDSEKNIILVLSQADTLLFNPNIKIVEVQIKVETTGNDVFVIGEYRFRLEDIYDEEEFDLKP